MNERLDCAIIGGGVAGLAAAQLLQESGKRVSLFERRSDPGGRIQTRWDGVEMGAEKVHGDGPLKRYCEKMELTLSPIEDGPEHMYLQGADGRLHSEAASSHLPFTLLQNMHTSVDADAGRALYEDAEGYLRVASRETGSDAHSANLLRMMLRNEYGVSSLRNISAFGVTEGSSFHDQNFAIREGYGALIERMARGIEIRGNSPVDAVEVKGTDVLVHCRNQTHAAATAIIAVPLAALQNRKIQLIPGPSESLHHAIHGIGLGTVCKIQCAMGDRLLEPEMHEVMTADPYAPIIYPALASDPRRITVFLGGERAREVEKAKPNDARALLQAALRRVFQTKVNVERILRTTWNTEPSFGMSYSYLRPGKRNNLRSSFEDVHRGRVAFAGEHATAQRCAGTVEGALLSGQRAARQMREVLSEGGAAPDGFSKDC